MAERESISITSVPMHHYLLGAANKVACIVMV